MCESFPCMWVGGACLSGGDTLIIGSGRLFRKGRAARRSEPLQGRAKGQLDCHVWRQSGQVEGDLHRAWRDAKDEFAAVGGFPEYAEPCAGHVVDPTQINQQRGGLPAALNRLSQQIGGPAADSSTERQDREGFAMVGRDSEVPGSGGLANHREERSLHIFPSHYSSLCYNPPTFPVHRCICIRARTIRRWSGAPFRAISLHSRAWWKSTSGCCSRSRIECAVSTRTRATSRRTRSSRCSSGSKRSTSSSDFSAGSTGFW